MKKSWHQLSLSFLIIVIAVVSAYFAGRFNQIEKTRRAEVELQTILDRYQDLKNVSLFWEKRALNYRGDIADTGIKRLAIWRDPSRLQVVSNFSTKVSGNSSGGEARVRTQPARPRNHSRFRVTRWPSCATGSGEASRRRNT